MSTNSVKKYGYAILFSCIVLLSSLIGLGFIPTSITASASNSTSSPVHQLDIGLSMVLNLVNSISPIKTNDTGAPNYVLYYSFKSTKETTFSGHFSIGSGCSGGCEYLAYPFLANQTSTLSIRLMDNQTSPKVKLYPVDINGGSDNFSLTVYGTSTAYWCIKSLDTCYHSYSLTGTTSSTVPRTAQVNATVSEANTFSYQSNMRLSVYGNFSSIMYQLTQESCPTWSFNQGELYELVPLILDPLFIFGPEETVVIEFILESATHAGNDLVAQYLASSQSYGSQSPTFELPPGAPNLPFLCQNLAYTMLFADNDQTPPIYYDVQNLISLVSSEQNLVNTNIKPNNATLLSNLASQNSTISQAIQDLSGLNSTLYSFVQIPSSCQVFVGNGDGPCAPYAQYMITEFMDPLGHALKSDLNYTSASNLFLTNST